MLIPIGEMHRSVMRYIVAAYRKDNPDLAQDATEDAMRKAMAEMRDRWLSRFDEMADNLAGYFATAAEKRTSAALKKILKDSGWTVDFEMTPGVQKALGAIIEENVELIRSIPEQYLNKVEDIVTEGVNRGRDIGYVRGQLEERLGVTARRAKFIARDQIEKATSLINRERCTELGLYEHEWQHSHGGHDPRPTHVKAGADKVRFDIRYGWFDPDVGEHIWPGQLPNCKCLSRPIVEGFD